MLDTACEQLRRLLATFDESGLIALANKGLVRRAQKDLDAGGLSHEETADVIVVCGPGWTVRMPPQGPTHATDDTKATGITRQILTATMYLRDVWASMTTGGSPVADVVQKLTRSANEGVGESSAGSPSLALRVSSPNASERTTGDPPAATIREQFLAIDPDAIRSWAGQRTFEAGRRLLESVPKVEIEETACLVIRFVGHDVEARVLPAANARSAGKWLDQVLTTAPKSQQTEWVVAGALALQRMAGVNLAGVAESLPRDDGAPRSRHEILASVRGLLASMLTTGLAHPSSQMRERLLTLSVSAVGVHLPRLARLLRSLADDVSLILARDAKADIARLLDRLVMASVLSSAITAAGDRPALSLIGQPRTEYMPVGDLSLAGLGAFPWRTASGFEGLTVLFWEASGQRLLTWSNSRPISTTGRFDPAHAFRNETIWPGGASAEQLARSQFRLRDARLNALGRLSGSQQSSVSDISPLRLDTLDFGRRAFSDWGELATHLRRSAAIGLREFNPLDRLVILRPHRWGERVFNELGQPFSWSFLDPHGGSLEVSLPWADLHETPIEFLEAVKPDLDQLTAVVVRVTIADEGVRFEPLTLLSRGTLCGDQVLCPAFDRNRIQSTQSTLLERLRAKFGRDRIATTIAEDDDPDELPYRESLPPSLERPLSEAESLLHRVAESGTARLNDLTRKRLQELATTMDRLDLVELSQAVRTLSGYGNAQNLIAAGYLCRLHREAVV